MTVFNLTAHFGKPTTGRIVYKGGDGQWIWQCDMCNVDGLGVINWSVAVSQALDHAYLCPHVNAKNRSYRSEQGRIR